jgi:hypothetical protein
MTRRRLVAIGAGGALVLVLAAVAWTQTRPDPVPIPSEITLVPSRTEVAALDAARKDPLAARLQGVLAQDPATRPVLAQAAASPVPVLAPSDPALLRTARLYSGTRHYMLVVQRGEQIIEIYGTTKAFQSPLARPLQPPEPVLTPPTRATRVAPATAALARARAQGLINIRTERTEYGVDVSFNRFGAAYSVSFICEGQGAPGCAEADALAFATSLQLIGGGA